MRHASLYLCPSCGPDKTPLTELINHPDPDRPLWHFFITDYS